MALRLLTVYPDLIRYISPIEMHKQLTSKLVAEINRDSSISLNKEEIYNTKLFVTSSILEAFLYQHYELKDDFLDWFIAKDIEPTIKKLEEFSNVYKFNMN